MSIPLPISPTIKIAAVPPPPQGAQTVFGYPSYMARMYGDFHGLTPALTALEADVLFLEDTGFGSMLAQFRAIKPSKPLRVYLWDESRLAHAPDSPEFKSEEKDGVAILRGKNA